MIRIQSKWYLCLITGDDTSTKYMGYIKVFNGLYPSEEEITNFTRDNDCVIISMQRLKFGKFGFVKRNGVNKYD